MSIPLVRVDGKILPHILLRGKVFFTQLLLILQGFLAYQHLSLFLLKHSKLKVVEGLLQV